MFVDDLEEDQSEKQEPKQLKIHDNGSFVSSQMKELPSNQSAVRIPVLCDAEEYGSKKEGRKVLLKTSKTKGKDEVFDVTRILTNDAVLPSPSEEKKESVFKISCFNCGGEHTIQQCDIPLNQRRIAVNRAAHFNNKRSIQERYTTAGDAGSTGTCNMRPGEISDALREALGIGPNDIPEWIYRMRRKGFIDGYPPGYLAEALDQSSSEESLLEFHTDDKTLGTPRIVRGTPRIVRIIKRLVVAKCRSTFSCLVQAF
ncbi:hypothetical protein WUBG_15144 [Wuchereria bancrofti]|uniref:PSP proline-rich domain-containing protein n=1 Tax=Wuchereria bancrofti TaxID=6293 RepID=J9AIE9_WUCBA|nr:hypothetical protein WUBG_15144 [Wuchereria bancrofti]